MSLMVLPVPCVRSRDGWCVIASGEDYEGTPNSVNTLCGYVVILPWAGARRLPDCPLCLEALRKKQREND
jgi:hypothetical protein